MNLSSFKEIMKRRGYLLSREWRV